MLVMGFRRLMSFHTRVQVINGKPANPSSEALIEPQLTPPIHGDKITEPLMSKLVGNDVCDPVAIAVCRCSWIEEHCGCTKRNVSGILY
jgi:hypothetical protein